jgi:hypothetical protein
MLTLALMAFPAAPVLTPFGAVLPEASITQAFAEGSGRL